MSTRSITIVKNREKWIDWDIKKPVEKSGELMRFYRHRDGYPDGHGLQMAAAFMDAQVDGILDNRNWCAASSAGSSTWRRTSTWSVPMT